MVMENTIKVDIIKVDTIKVDTIKVDTKDKMTHFKRLWDLWRLKLRRTVAYLPKMPTKLLKVSLTNTTSK